MRRAASSVLNSTSASWSALVCFPPDPFPPKATSPTAKPSHLILEGASLGKCHFKRQSSERRTKGLVLEFASLCVCAHVRANTHPELACLLTDFLWAGTLSGAKGSGRPGSGRRGV